MKLKTHWTLILIIFIAISLSGWTRQVNRSPNNVWEYKVVSIDSPVLEKELNQLGEQGWELILLEQNQQFTNRYYFKRVK